MARRSSGLGMPSGQARMGESRMPSTILIISSRHMSNRRRCRSQAHQLAEPG